MEPKKKPDNSYIFAALLGVILLFSFILYVILFTSPSGSDVYTHMYNTQRMADSNSLAEFYEKSMIEEYSGYDYPFGLWYFGSIVMKITGADVYTIAYLIPLLLLFGTLFIYYCYANEFLASREQSILTLLFLVSMPMIAIAQLNLSTSIFVMPLLVAIIFLSIRPPGWINSILIFILVFTLCFTHTGTFLFLITFAVIYFLLRALIWRRIELNFYTVILALLFCYTTVVQIFPFIQPQYIDKGRLITSTTLTISSAVHIDIIRNAGDVFYNTVLVSNNYIFAFLWSAMIFFTAKFLLYLRRRADKLYAGSISTAGLPIIGNLTNLSKDILATPLWIGPIQAILSIIGVFKIDSRGKCIALTLVITSILPGALGGSEGTGALREIYYLLLLIPITSAAGFYVILPRIREFEAQSFSKKSIAVLIYLIIFIPLIAVPIVGCLHYQPSITMTAEERTNLGWLSNIGDPIEGAAGNAYRDRMTMYANKSVPSVPAGTATKQFSKDLYDTYFSADPEDATRDLSSYQVKYLISSARTMKGFTQPKDSLKIDQNQQVDKIYASGKFFGIYQIISSPPAEKATFTEPIVWIEPGTDTKIQDVGSVFLVENDNYKIKLSDTTPKIRYLGTKTGDYLGEGDYSDVIVLFWDYFGNNTPQSTTIDLNDLTFPSIMHSDNVITYSTTLTGLNSSEKLGTLSVKYIFYDKAFHREIVIANDFSDAVRAPDLSAIVYTSFFIPMDTFEFHKIESDDTSWVQKTIFPAEDSVQFNDIQYDALYLNNGQTGIFINYDPTAPLPTKLTYKGSQFYSYGTVTTQGRYTLKPSESVKLSQYYSVGTKASAMKNVKRYTSISRYDYKNGQIPLIITGMSQNTNETPPDYSAAFSMMRDFNVPFTINVPTGSAIPSAGSDHADVIGLLNVIENNTYQPRAVQENEIHDIVSNSINGVIIPTFKYDLTTMQLLSDNNISSGLVLPVRSPVEEFFQVGYREIKSAMIEGDPSELVLLPVSLPSSNSLNPYYDTEEVFKRWNDTIDTGLENDAIIVFEWDLNDLSDPDFSDDFRAVLQHSIERNLTPVTPDSVAEHYQKINTISSIIRQTDDVITIDTFNTGNSMVNGLTYKIELPVISDGCPYTVGNGSISRINTLGETCILYVSSNISGGERKTITVASEAVKESFSPNIPPLYQGKNTITIRDLNNKSISNADVIVDTIYYQTDEDGKITVSLIRGSHTIRIQKAGYETMDITMEVKPVIYKYLPFIQ